MTTKHYPPVETIEREGLDTKLLRKKGHSKTFRGYLIQKMKEARDQKNFEIAFMLQELYKTFMSFEELKKSNPVQIEIIEGWKGTDNIEIIKDFKNDFIIKSHIKDKETGEVTSTTHQIEAQKVNTLFSWVKTWKVGEKKKCYDFAIYLGYKDWKSLWKERKQYFELYYYPIKVLEALNFIKYSGRGIITRLK
jgi:hypothetical protein